MQVPDYLSPAAAADLLERAIKILETAQTSGSAIHRFELALAVLASNVMDGTLPRGEFRPYYNRLNNALWAALSRMVEGGDKHGRQDTLL